MKKFIISQIELILIVAILVCAAYNGFCSSELSKMTNLVEYEQNSIYYLENEYNLKINSQANSLKIEVFDVINNKNLINCQVTYAEIFAIFAIIFIFFIEFVELVVAICILIPKIYKFIKYKRIETRIQEPNVTELKELPDYGAIFASVIYFNEIHINRIKNVLYKYLKNNYIIDENNNIEEEKIDKLKQIEKEFLPLLKSNEIFLSEKEELLNKELEIKILKELEKKDFIKHRPLKYSFTDINIKNLILILIPIFIPVAATQFENQLIIFLSFILVMIYLIILIFKCEKISLNENGEEEKIKLLHIAKNLKKSEDLNEEEKMFLDIIDEK